MSGLPETGAWIALLAPRADIAPAAAARYGSAGKGLFAMPQAGKTTHFGYQEVPLADKQALVDGVFRSVAGRYDLMNDLMSGGLHRAWKDALVNAVNPPKVRPGRLDQKNERPFHLLDLAGGTGDIAFRTIEAGGVGTHATVVDINADMLEVGRARAAARGFDQA